MRFKELTLDYFHDWCEQIFGYGIIPEVKGTNIRYGGTNFVGTNIIFVNGDEDPWQHASMLE